MTSNMFYDVRRSTMIMLDAVLNAIDNPRERDLTSTMIMLDAVLNTIDNPRERDQFQTMKLRK